jgi:hypothetical protein
MPRRRPKTAREKILAVVKWARGTGFNNITAELGDALQLLPADRPGKRP